MGRSRILMAIVFLLFNGLLLIPALAVPGKVPWLAVEALAIWALLALRQRPPGLLLRTLALGYGVLVLLVAADALLRESLGRGLNLYLEVGLVDAAWHLLHTNLGTAGAVLALTTTAAGLVVAIPFAALAAWIEFRLRRIHKTINSTLVSILNVADTPRSNEDELWPSGEAVAARPREQAENNGFTGRQRFAHATG